MDRLLIKLDGWPATAIALALAGTLAFFVHQHYTELSDEKVKALTELSAAQDRNYELIKALSDKDSTIASFQGQIGDIANTVGTLEKLAQTDEELLKKYSKVYFLNENYVPAGLIEVDRPFLSKQATNTKILARVSPYLEKLITAASRDHIDLLVASAYRSFGTQAALKTSYKVTYGSGANSFSADQGYSEHQLGTTVDFTTAKLGADFSGFAKDVAYQWLLNHAHEYGFVLSYPAGNSYYQFEPWHWRYVSVKLATDLHDKGKHFYDLDQREIDKYLINLFE